MKQQPLTILIALLSMFSFGLGHATIKINDMWKEEAILWIVINLKQVFIRIVKKSFWRYR